MTNGPDVSRETILGERLSAYGELLVSVAQPRGLVGFGRDALEEQLARSLVLLQVLGRPRRLVDVGSGAGLPGVPLAIALGGTVLVEPRRKAAAFLELVVRELDLDAEVEVLTAEEAARGRLREWGAAVVARALAEPAAAAELCSPLCGEGGVVVLTAHPSASASDLDVALLPGLGLGSLRVETLRDAARDIEQRVLMMSKVAPTPDTLPRPPGAAKRRPLGRHAEDAAR